MHLLSEVDGILRRADNRLAAWKDLLASNPGQAFEWSVNAFQAAADLEVWGQLKKSMDSPRDGEPTLPPDLAHYQNFYRGQVLRGAKYPVHSTNKTTNLFEQCKFRAYGECLEFINGAIEAEYKVK